MVSVWMAGLRAANPHLVTSYHPFAVSHLGSRTLFATSPDLV
jgi:hypothetical protein